MTKTFALPPALFISSDGAISTDGTSSNDTICTQLWWNTDTLTLDIADAHSVIGSPLNDSRNYKLLQQLNFALKYERPLGALYRIFHSIPEGCKIERVAGLRGGFSHLTKPERAHIRRVMKGHPFLDQLVSRGNSDVLKVFAIFAMDANPSVPGTPYLVPSGGYSAPSWHLQYVQMPELSRHSDGTKWAAWCDTEKIKELVTTCKETDPEFMETMALLEGSGDAEKIRAIAQEKTLIESARTAFRSRKLRVNVSAVKEMVDHADRRVLASGTVTYRRCIRRRTLETLDLLPTLSELPGNERAMNVGVRVSLHEQDLDSGQDMFLDEITDLAETSGTCSVFVEKNVTGPVVLWMVRDLKLAQKFLLPFHAGKDSQLVPIAEWLAQNGR